MEYMFLSKMKTFIRKTTAILYALYFIYTNHAAPQQPEINDQYETQNQYENKTKIEDVVLTEKAIVTIEENEIVPVNVTRKSEPSEVTVPPTSVTSKIFRLFTRPLTSFVTIPKVNSVLRNIGTCIVNGAMELITYYFPPPLIPLIATAAGMIIPFEPVVMLREKMPVTSYRRAFRTALNSFLSTFDRYKLDDEDDDPYMTRRFNRRLMNESGDKNKENE